jgi:hypothetical protein
MISKATILLFALPLFTSANGQTRTITGKIIDEQFNAVYQTKIFTVDTLLLTTSDTKGNFKVNVPPNTKSILVGSIGMEWKSIEVTNNCNYLEIVLLPAGTYDFISAVKVDRLRRNHFDKLPAIHKSAFEKGIFTSSKPCYIDSFIPVQKRLREIHKNRA